MKRPRSVTVVAALLIFMGLSTAYTTITYYSDPAVQQALAGKALSPAAQLVWTIVGIVVLVGSGVLMLGGMNIARMTYLIYTPVAIIANAVLFGVSLASLWGLFVFSVFAVLLTRPLAKAYFVPTPSEPTPTSRAA
jgi:hypothetical protein